MKVNANYGRVKSATRILIEIEQKKDHPVGRLIYEHMEGITDENGDIIFESLTMSPTDQRTIIDVEDIPEGFTQEDVEKSIALFKGYFLQADKDYKPKKKNDIAGVKTKPKGE